MIPVTTSTFELRPIDPDDAERLRQRAAGTAVYVADQHPGYPCRQCLQDAQIGEELLLVSYDPFTVDSPYRSASPIFLHRTPCRPPADLRTLPRQLTGRLLSVRSFDARALMVDAAVVAGDDLAGVLDRLLADERVDHVHVHNAERGCWAVRVDRSGFCVSDNAARGRDRSRRPLARPMSGYPVSPSRRARNRSST